MENNNPILQFIDKYLLGFGAFLGGAFMAWSPAIIARLTGRDKAEIKSIEQKTNDETIAAATDAAKVLVATTEKVTKMYSDLNEEQREMYEAKLKIVDAENARLRIALRDVEKKLTTQNDKLRAQIEKLRVELQRVRQERDVYRKQLDKAHITPDPIPYTLE